MGWEQDRPRVGAGEPGWRATGNVKGPQGDPGPKGETGATGDPEDIDLTDLVALFDAVLN